jgi:hypothetical protein
VDNDLPFIDEHRIFVAAPAAAVWRCLGAELSSVARGGAAYAHLIAADPGRASGTLLTEGATVPGFAVAAADPERRALLAGRHRFSRYTLDLTLVPESGGTTLSARSHAEFPGLLGGVYRALVIRSGGHRVLVRRLLRTIASRAERAAA